MSDELAFLRSQIEYNPTTGAFRWLTPCRGRVMSRDPGVLYARGDKRYLTINIHRRRWMAHRLAVYLMTGTPPEFEVDHIDHNGLNNIYTNLRPVTCAENQKNRGIYRTNTSGHPGVRLRPSGNYSSSIGAGRNRKFLGTFTSFDEARAARLKAERELGYHPNHGAKRLRDELDAQIAAAGKKK